MDNDFLSMSCDEVLPPMEEMPGVLFPVKLLKSFLVFSPFSDIIFTALRSHSYVLCWVNRAFSPASSFPDFSLLSLFLQILFRFSPSNFLKIIKIKFLCLTAQKMKFSIRISSENATKSAENCRFRHICWRHP